MLEFFKKKNTTKNRILFFVFIFTLIIFTLTPIAGDDWGNYLVGKKGLIVSINNAIGMYKTWEGRFISRILISYLTYNKWIWNILNAFLMTFLVSLMYKYLSESKNKIVLLIPLLGLLLVNTLFSSQCYLWLAGNITYFFPAVIALAVFTYIYKLDGQIIKKMPSILLIIISFIVPMFVENIGCAYVVGLFILLIYYFKRYRKIPTGILLMLITSIVGLLIMVLSPGSQLRMELNQEFLNMNIFEKIFYNIPNFIKYVFTKNIFILVLMLIPINKYMLDYFKTNKYKKIILTLFNIIPIITIIENSIYMLPMGINITYPKFLYTFNSYYIIYWIVFGLIYILSIFKYIKLKKDKEYIFMLVLIAVSSMAVMLLTPTWGERVSALYIFIIILSTTRILSEFTINKSLNKILFTILILVVSLNATYAIANKIFDVRRTNMIEKQLNNQEEIYIYYHGLTTLWNYTPFEEYHVNTFKRYYGIDEDVKLTVKFLGKKEYIKYLFTGENKEE